MNSFYAQEHILLDGVTAPFTGEFYDITRLKQCGFVAYASGNGTVKLEFESPFFEGSGVSFYEFPTMMNSYGPTVSLDTPIKSIRATCSGVGKFWVSLMGQN
jgi:hypothetical protein